MILDWRGPRRQRAARASSEIRTPGRRRLRLAVGEGLPLKQVGACNLPFGQKSRECNRFLARVADMKVGRRPASTTALPMLRARPAADGDAGIRPKYLLVPRYRGGQGQHISLGRSTRLRGGPARQGNAARVAEPGRLRRAGAVASQIWNHFPPPHLPLAVAPLRARAPAPGVKVESAPIRDWGLAGSEQCRSIEVTQVWTDTRAGRQGAHKQAGSRQAGRSSSRQGRTRSLT